MTPIPPPLFLLELEVLDLCFRAAPMRVLLERETRQRAASMRDARFIRDHPCANETIGGRFAYGRLPYRTGHRAVQAISNAEHASKGADLGKLPQQSPWHGHLDDEEGRVPSSKAQTAGALRASAIENSQRRRPSSWISER